jgi:hypothetical protein
MISTMAEPIVTWSTFRAARRAIPVYVLVALNAIRRDLKKPGQYDCGNEAEGKDQNDGPGGPLGGAERRQDGGQNLG